MYFNGFQPGFQGPQHGMPGHGGGLMGQFARGSQDGSLVGRERGIAGRAIMDAQLTEAMAKQDGVVTDQERMAICCKKMKARNILNHLRTNGMGNISTEALARLQNQAGGPGFGGPGFGGPGFGNPGFGGPGFGGPGAWANSTPNANIAISVSNGGPAQAIAGGPNGARAIAG
jgi:hypothetical protein